MSSTSVSILVPLAGPAPELPSTLETIERYLQATGFAFDIRVLDRRDGAGYGAMIRRGAADAGGSVVIIVDPDLPYPVSAIGDADRERRCDAAPESECPLRRLRANGQPLDAKSIFVREVRRFESESAAAQFRLGDEQPRRVG